MKPVRWPQRKRASRVHSELAAGIGRRILDGAYQPGPLLPNEAAWGEIFGALRTAVRGATKTLNGKGLRVSRPKIERRSPQQLAALETALASMFAYTTSHAVHPSRCCRSTRKW